MCQPFTNSTKADPLDGFHSLCLCFEEFIAVPTLRIWEAFQAKHYWQLALKQTKLGLNWGKTKRQLQTRARGARFLDE